MSRIHRPSEHVGELVHGHAVHDRQRKRPTFRVRQARQHPSRLFARHHQCIDRDVQDGRRLVVALLTPSASGRRTDVIDEPATGNREKPRKPESLDSVVEALARECHEDVLNEVLRENSIAGREFAQVAVHLRGVQTDQLLDRVGSLQLLHTRST